MFICNVIFQAGSRIDGQLDALINWAPKSAIILRSIDIIGIVLRVIDVFFCAIDTQALLGDLKFALVTLKADSGSWFVCSQWRNLEGVSARSVTHYGGGVEFAPNDINARTQTRILMVLAWTPFKVPTSTAIDEWSACFSPLSTGSCT